jgi:large subunit ribosomal protein L10
MVVVKNTLLKKALENVEGDYSPALCFEGKHSCMFSNVANAPAKLY